MKIRNLLIVSFALFVSLSLSGGVNAQKKKVITTKKTTVSAKGNLSVEAGLVFNSGDVKPVARVNFYLLDDNLETILSNAGIEAYQTIDTSGASKGALLGGMRAKKKSVSFVESYAVWSSSPDLYGEQLLQSKEALKPHIIATITTDFSGKGEFSQVKPGNYYLMGVGGTGKQAVLWNMPIEIKAGKQSVILDNKNAAEIF